MINLAYFNRVFRLLIVRHVIFNSIIKRKAYIVNTMYEKIGKDTLRHLHGSLRKNCGKSYFIDGEP